MSNTLFIPEIIQAGIDEKFGSTALASIAKVVYLDSTVKGGDKIKVSKTKYVGDATEVQAGAEIPISDFTQATDEVEIKKLAKAVSVTQEEINSAYMDVPVEATNQITASLNGGLDTNLCTNLANISNAMTHTATETSLSLKVVSDALAKFGEDTDSIKFLIVSPNTLAQLRNDSKFTVNSFSDDSVKSVGNVYGCDVIVSARVANDEAFIINENALVIYKQKDSQVESDKNIRNQTELYVGTVFAGTQLANEQGAVKIKLATEG